MHCLDGFLVVPPAEQEPPGARGRMAVGESPAAFPGKGAAPPPRLGSSSRERSAGAPGRTPRGGSARPEDRDAGFCIFSPDPQPRAGRLGGGGREQGWPRGAERLRGVGWRRDGVLSRSSPDSAAEPPSQPLARGRARSGIFSEPLECGRVYLLLLLLLLLLSFGWGHSGYSCCCICAEGEGAKMERECGGRDEAPPAGRWCAASFPFLAPAAPGLPCPPRRPCLPDCVAAACCHSTRPQPRASQ